MTTMNVAQAKFEAMVAQGKAKALAGLDALNKEWKIRHDFMAKPAAIDVEFEVLSGVETDDGASKPGAMRLVVEAGAAHRNIFDLTRHARGQLLSMAKVPAAFADTLGDYGLTDLLRSNLRTLLARTSPGGVLVREVEGTAKGILSPAYRRMDASPMFETFVTTAMKQGLVPHDGLVTDTRAFVSFIEPRVVELLPGEHVVFALELRNSDYGNGALDMALGVWRLLCTNGMIGQSMFRKIHLGKRFDGFGEGEVVKLSEKTLTLDSATLRSAMTDTMRALPAHIEATTETLRSIAGKEVNLTAALAKLSKAGLRKATVEKVKALYETAQPVESLPQSAGAWRFANVLSLLANDPALPGDEAHDLREIGGSWLVGAKAAA